MPYTQTVKKQFFVNDLFVYSFGTAWYQSLGATPLSQIKPNNGRKNMLLKVGSQGDDVRKMQAFLKITADGIFGPDTEKAVINWQTANNLNADGIVGPVTWSKMFPENKPPARTDSSSAPAASIPGPNLEKLKGHVPDAVFVQIPDVAAKFQINTPLRLAHFIAQCDHESAGFKTTEENLNYSADGLNKTFGKYFSTVSASDYAHQPEKIGARVYANRMGNGNEASKEGYIYRGRGYIQLTGKDSYKAFDKVVDDDIVSNPDLVSKKYPLLSAASYWVSRSLNASADKGSSDAVVTEITNKINGGTAGLSERIELFNE